MAEVVLNNVRKNYDPAVHKDTLRNINLAIKEGEFIVFVGPSGCGKSTLLRMIAGLEDITSGELTIGARDGSYPGMQAGREIHVRFIDGPRADAGAVEPRADTSVRYDGKPLVVKKR